MLLSRRSNHHSYRLVTAVATIDHLHCRGIEIRRMLHNYLAYAGREVVRGIANDF